MQQERTLSIYPEYAGPKIQTGGTRTHCPTPQAAPSRPLSWPPPPPPPPPAKWQHDWAGGRRRPPLQHAQSPQGTHPSSRRPPLSYPRKHVSPHDLSASLRHCVDFDGAGPAWPAVRARHLPSSPARGARTARAQRHAQLGLPADGSTSAALRVLGAADATAAGVRRRSVHGTGPRARRPPVTSAAAATRTVGTRPAAGFSAATQTRPDGDAVFRGVC